MHVQVDSLFKLTSSPSLFLLLPSHCLPAAPQLSSWSILQRGLYQITAKLSCSVTKWRLRFTRLSLEGELSRSTTSFPTAPLLLGQKTSLGGLRTSAAARSRDTMTRFGGSRRRPARGCRGCLGKWRCIPKWTLLFSIPLQCTSLTLQFLISLSKVKGRIHMMQWKSHGIRQLSWIIWYRFWVQTTWRGEISSISYIGGFLSKHFLSLAAVYAFMSCLKGRKGKFN